MSPFVRGAAIKAGLGFLVGFLPVWILSFSLAETPEAVEILRCLAWVLGAGGAMAGVGVQFVKTFGEAPRQEGAAGSIRENVVEQVAEAFLGPVAKIAKALFWIGTKDFRSQQPRRGRRALLGAAVLAPVGLFASSVILFSQHSETAVLWNLALAFLFGLACGLIGGILGSFSDSF